MNAHDQHPLHGPAASAADEPAGAVAADSPALPACPPHGADSSLFEAALDAGRDASGRATRADGWTRERIAAFLFTLAETGSAADASRAVGMSLSGAYALRNRARGRSFALAWDAAVLRAHATLAEKLTSRAIHGWEEPIFYQGEVCGHRRRFDNRLGIRLLNRHDRREAATERRAAAARLVADEFEAFVAIAAGGGEGAVDFVGERLYARREADEADLLERAANYHRCGGALAREIDVSDLDPADRASWTGEQAGRARRSGLLDRLAEEPGEPESAAEQPESDGSDPA